MKSLLLILLLGYPLCIHAACSLPKPADLHWCRDENGAQVDWWILYKPPGRDHYVYRTSSTSSSNGNKLLNIRAPQDSHMGCTVHRLIAVPSSPPEYYSFNDLGDSEDTPVPNPLYGLGKGLLVQGSTSGYWMSHTIVGLQFKPGVGFNPPTNISQQGHSAVCVSLPYPNDMTSVFKRRLCHMKARANQNNPIPCDGDGIAKSHFDFLHIAKQAPYSFMSNAHNPTPAHTKDGYERLADSLKSNSPLIVQAGTSSNRIPSGGGINNSNCIHYVLEGRNGTSKQSVDHAKLAWDKDTNTYFFGDTARTQYQKVRGGGGISFALPGSPFVELSTANCPN